jgi:hypothetical protein
MIYDVDQMTKPYPPQWKTVHGFDEESLLFHLSMAEDSTWFLHVFFESWKVNGDFAFAIEMANDVTKEYPTDPREDQQ